VESVRKNGTHMRAVQLARPMEMQYLRKAGLRGRSARTAIDSCLFVFL